MLKAILPLAVSALLSTSVSAQGDDFSQSYQKYNEAVAAGKPAGEYAKEAYELGVEKFGKDSVNAANLAINYAGTLGVHSKELREQRRGLYQQALSILTKDKQTSELTLIDPLFGLAKSADEWKSAVEYLEKAIEIAKESDKPKFVADIQVNAAEVLIQRHRFRRAAMIQARVYLDEAEGNYDGKLAQDTVEYVRLNLNQAFAEASKRNVNHAIERLLNVVNVFDDNFEFDHTIELQAHSMLVELYEAKGESDNATEHCLAIAKMRPWTADAEQTPLYRVHPKYPVAEAKKGKNGWVEMQITIDSAGFVEQAEILDSEGGAGFELESRKAVEQWRYAPKFENGQPVAATTKVRLDFKLGS
ncbi:energy transducer TonB [Pseudoalteromonas sp. T1lg48]|uniref:energy transducer TonB n=1 Tax=Pseudoalteromonas sp. T1lg48 TaxID=2077100 RepID=UPI000CF725FF|nr:energy transducer TonB [Pseudoalteromonas sp. T1lg48]